MRNNCITFFRTLLAIIVSVLAIIQPAQSKENVVDFIVAQIDNDVILNSEFQNFKRIALFEKKYQGVSNKELLDALILRRIELNRSKEMNLRVNDSEINAWITELANKNNVTVNQFLGELQKFPGGVRGYRDYLYNNLVVDRYRSIALRSLIQVSEADARNFLLTEAGQKSSRLLYTLAFISLDRQFLQPEPEDNIEQLVLFLEGEADFQQQVKDIKTKFPEAQSKVLSPTRLEDLPTLFANKAPLLRAGEAGYTYRNEKVYIFKVLGITLNNPVYSNEVKLRHILLRPSILRTREQTHVEIQNILQRIVDGESFSKMAIAYSEDRGSATRGGELDWTPLELLDPSIALAVNQLVVNTVSEPVESGDGYHIIEVIGRENRDISERQEILSIRNFLFQQKIADEIPQLIARLKEEAFIEIKHDPESL